MGGTPITSIGFVAILAVWYPSHLKGRQQLISRVVLLRLEIRHGTPMKL
jgi:hypothetical protein